MKKQKIFKSFDDYLRWYADKYALGVISLIEYPERSALERTWNIRQVEIDELSLELETLKLLQ